MKKNKLVLIGSLIVVTLGVLFTISSVGFDSEGDYKKSEFSFLKESSIDDAAAWMAARMRDPETGQRISETKLKLIEKAIGNMPAAKGLPIVWEEEGPDNIGGRTRAVLSDRSNPNRMYAGSVSGGMFTSINGGNLWTRLTGFTGSKFISSIAQMKNGTIIVTTGISTIGDGDPMAEFDGNGAYYSTDFGVTWTLIPGSDTYSKYSEASCGNNSNTVYLGTTSGLKTWDFGAASLSNVSGVSGACNAMKMSKDGSIIVCAIGTSNKTTVSTDGGLTWNDRSGSASTGKVPSSSSVRIEYAISAGTNSNNKYTLYAVRTTQYLQGMHVSHDSGETWSEFIGGITPPSNIDIYRDQGRYNSTASVDPTNSKNLFIGGIDIWKWSEQTSSPAFGAFEKQSNWFVSPTSTNYVHADNHEMHWDENNRLILGNDGGVGISSDFGATWKPANRGYNVTQFYGMAFDKYGSVAGGAQDNGTLYNNHTLITPQQFREIAGGDGFSCEISFFNPDIIFSTLYYGATYRSGNAGSSSSSFIPTYPGSYPATGDASTYFPFFNSIALAEYYDVNSKDSVFYAPTEETVPAGTEVEIQSATTGKSMKVVLPNTLYFDDQVTHKASLTEIRNAVTSSIDNITYKLDNYSYTPYASASGTNPPSIGDSLTVNLPNGPLLVVVDSLSTYKWHFAVHPITNKTIELGTDSVAIAVAWDTITIQDPYQSWFVSFNTNNGAAEVWGTRDALRLSTTDTKWVLLAKNLGTVFNGDLVDFAFSKDMNHLYVSTGTRVTRIDGLGSLYTSDDDFAKKAGYSGTNLTVAPTGSTVSTIFSTGVNGIAVDPKDADNLLVFPSSGNIQQSNNATSASPTFSSLSSISGSNSPFVYDGIIDRDDEDIMVVGTSHGVFVSSNGGASWTPSSTGFEGTPVYQVRQSTKTYGEGNHIPGTIFIATHGRGIWKSSSLLGLKDNDKNASENFNTNLRAYPNPTLGNTSIAYELFEAGSVEVNVYSITGSKVRTITKKSVAKGYNTLDLNANDLPKGTYIVKFNSGNQNQTTKFIKL